MRIPQSKIGLTLSTLYLLVSAFLILSQGLFGESFIAIVLGLPWSFLMIYFNLTISENNPLFPIFLYIWVLGPVIVNIILFYWIGVGIEKLFSKRKSTVKTWSQNK